MFHVCNLRNIDFVSAINSLANIVVNVLQLLTLVAMRYHCFVRANRMGNHQNDEFHVELVQELLQHFHRCAQQKCSKVSIHVTIVVDSPAIKVATIMILELYKFY